MNKKYKNVIFIDTEFVSSKDYKQPIQISFVAYRLEGNNFIYDKTYSTYILLDKGVRLNKYVKAFTGIDEQILRMHGILSREVRIQLLDFLYEYTLTNTLIIGWDIANDKTMINSLLNREEELFDINLFDWYDAVVPYKRFYDKENQNTPSLINACFKLEISGINFHDSYQDAVATQKVMQHMALEKGLGLLFNPMFINLKKEKNQKKKKKITQPV